MPEPIQIYEAEVINQTDDHLQVRADVLDTDVWVPRKLVLEESPLDREATVGDVEDLYVKPGTWSRDLELGA